MAQYDGSIRINTEISAKSAEKQLRALENNMEKTAEKAASLHDKMEALRTTQIPTQEYKDISNQIEKAKIELNKLLEKQEQMQREGKDSGVSWDRINEKIESTKGTIASAEGELKDLVDTGKAFTLGSSTEEYAKMGQQLKYLEAAQEVMNQQHVIAEERLDAALQKRDAEREKLGQIAAEEQWLAEIKANATVSDQKKVDLLERQKQITAEIKDLQKAGVSEGYKEYEAALATLEKINQQLNGEAAEEERLAEIKENATVADQELIDLLERRKEVMQEISDLQKAGVGEGYQEFYDAQDELSEINEQINAIREMRSSYVSLGDAVRNAFGTMAKGLRDIPIAIVKAGVNGLISLFNKLGATVRKSAVAPFKLLEVTAKKAFSSIGKSSKSSNNMFNKGFKNILKYGLGIRSVYALINKLRTAVKEGFSNLAQYSTPVNESLSMLKSSLTQLKNSLATAFAPILTTIAPLLKTLIDMISQAATYVGMFIATLTGASTFTKAIAVQEDYAASLNKTGSAAKKAAGALAKFDDLDVLAQPTSSGGGTGAAETPVTDMFEEVEIPDKFKDLTQWIKDMWAESDFTELGSFLGERLKESLDNIPWDSIQEKARNIGKSLATLINGAVETDGLGYTIGNTLAQGINTAFNFLNSFVHNLNWQGIGTFIAESLNGLFQNIDWNLIYDTFVTGAKGLGDAINSFTQTLDWETVASTVSNFVNTFIDTIYTFITTVDWAELGAKVGKTISDAWTGIDWGKAGETLGEYFKAFFDFVGNAIKAVNWQEVGKSVQDFLVNIDWAGVAESFFGAIGAALGGLAGFLSGLFEGMGDDIINGLLFGIGDAIFDIADWIWEHVFTPFIESFKEAFGIHSPSTVMAEMGTYIIEGLLEGITSLIENVTEIWENMKATALEIWENVKTGLSEKWETIKNTATTIFTTMKDSVSKIFDGLWGNIKGVINSILGGVEKMANGVVNAINTVIRALNGLSFDIPDWVPGNLGGKTFGFNIGEIPNVNIPRLATGAVIRGGNPFMAILGDQPAGKMNVEAPADLIKEMARQGIREELSSMNLGGRSSGQVISLNVNGEEFARLTMGDFLQEMGRQGYDVQVLGVN